jgi:2-polyprenyl-3-methyl-5-hydroxy-6-metoxy-1,4-benzoquinol methylase
MPKMNTNTTYQPYNYQRLDFRLPDFTRYAWVSDPARAIWEPRINQVTNMLLELEWRAIASGVRRCALRTVHPEQVSSLTTTLSPFNIEIEPLQKIAISKNYSASLQTANEDEPFTYWAVLGRKADIEAFKYAYWENDQDAIGRLLGYPECCTRFFTEVWVNQGCVDTTWQMAHESLNSNLITSHEIEIPQVSNSNILLRWLGVRAVFHLPCRFDCEATQQLADNLADVARNAGFDEELAWLSEMLRWPVEWSALHGIAEIKTPVVKISTRTDATPQKYTVRYLGDRYPEIGVQGLTFPYKRPAKRKVSDSQQYKAGLENPIQTIDEDYKRFEWYFRDNGFSSGYAMDISHQPILNLACSCLSQSSGKILDLGCGNGALLGKIWLKHQSVIPYGVDLISEKIAHAKLLLPEYEDNFAIANIFDVESFWTSNEKYSLVILMLGRLIEVPPIQINQLLSRLKDQTSQVLVYAYDDYIREYGSLEQMAKQIGVELLNFEASSNVCLAKFTA